MKKVKLGLIGCGLVVRDLHWPALRRMTDRLEITHVSSRNAENAASFAAECGAARSSADYHQLLADENVEAVVISYPFEMNYEITKDALAAGKHVLVEKPMAASMQQAKEMVAWEEDTRLVTMVAENFRYREALHNARRLIDEGAIGIPHTMLYTSINHFGRDSKWLTQSNWRLHCVGGIMLDKDVHFAAMMRMLYGNVKNAIGYQGLMRDDIGPVDYVTLHVVFESGAIGTLYDVSSVTGFSRSDVILVGSKGTLVLDQNFEALTLKNVEGMDVRLDFKDDPENSYIGEFDDFYQCIANGAKPVSTFREGYLDLQLGFTGLLSNDRWETLRLVT